jgi:ferredoxin
MTSRSWAAGPPQIGAEEVLAPTAPPPPPSRSGNDQELQGSKVQAQATEQESRPTNEKTSQVQADARRPSSLVAAVDAAQCTGCGVCAAVCPMGAITVDATATIETPSCTGCGVCAGECPEEAITLKRI